MRSSATIGCGVAFWWWCSLPVLGAADFGTVVSHNGTLGPSGTGTLGTVLPGTGDVQVDFVYPQVTFGPHVAEYFEVATHHAEYAYLSPSNPFMRARAFVVNSTAIAWQGFEIRLEGADFTGVRDLSPVQAASLQPVVDIGIGPDGVGDVPADRIAIDHPSPPNSDFSLLSSSISRFNDLGSGFTDAELTMLFDDPLPADNTFRLTYNVFPSPGAAGSAGFDMFLTPIPVPEPATGLLVGTVALAGVAPRRRGRVWPNLPRLWQA